MRKRIFEIIEISNGKNILSTIYDDVILMVIVLSLIPLTFKDHNMVFHTIENVVIWIFIIDYILHFLTADYLFNKKSITSFLRYPFSFFAMIDLICIVSSLIMLNNTFKLLRLFRMLRTLRVFHIFKAFHHSKGMIMITTVFKKQKATLMTIGTLTAVYILICALIIFNVEPDTFSSFFDAIYWATVSLTTIGYGDITMTTNTGHLVIMISSIFGILIVALSAGIMTAGYMTELNEEKKGHFRDSINHTADEFHPK